MRRGAERVSRFLARAGVASRRHADLLIEQGRVHVNGVRAALGQKVTPGLDRVHVDGREVLAREPPVYILLNKPPGYLSTCADPWGRPTVLELMKGVEARVFPVGRLDLDARGLLLLTNDGDLAHILTHPRHRVIKEYLVEVAGGKDPDRIRRILSGIIVSEKRVRADYARFVEPREDTGAAGEEMSGTPKRASGTSLIVLGVHEGEKHLVKTLCGRVGYKVLRLTRTRLGPLELSGLSQGEWRRLTRAEVAALYRDGRKGAEGDRHAQR